MRAPRRKPEAVAVNAGAERAGGRLGGRIGGSREVGDLAPPSAARFVDDASIVRCGAEILRKSRAPGQRTGALAK